MSADAADPVSDYWASRELACALSLGAIGLTCVQASVELLIDHEYWLRRADFTDSFVDVDTSVASPPAFIDWAGAIPIDLSDALTGLDRINSALVATAVLHAAGLYDQMIAPCPDLPPDPRGASQR